MKDKISLKHGYTLHFNEDDTLSLNIETEEYGTIEIEGRKGNLIDASDFEAYLNDEEEDLEMTLEDLICGTTEWLKDFDIDDETIEAICKDLTPWFERYAISEEDAILNKIADLESWIDGRRNTIADLMKRNDMHRMTIAEQNRKINENADRVFALHTDIEKLNAEISELKVKLKREKPQTYKCKMQVILELDADIEADTREEAEQKFFDLYRETPYADMDYVDGDYTIEEVR